MINRSHEVVQKFEYLLVMDFEATCERYTVLKPQEITRATMRAVLSICDWKPKEGYVSYIETVDDQPYFADVFSIFCESTGYYPKGLKDMLARLNVPLKEGRLHSGIDNVKNMVSIILPLKEKYNTQFIYIKLLHH
ncbi:hypothetical protein ALC57_14326 [Trachymyrmex cornetzi]|uniref:Exonuclease domain-containing protein n=1 Tax=Trachymyrmex cornetzi TaxID=471704 RepID=A0A151IYR8_9HYME|nr:hypothetical protein ALC57_14326 [Trachymyrmex cornetzi]